MKLHIIHIVKEILSFLFPFEELNDRPSVFIQQGWLEKNLSETHIKDYLWHPPAK
jgi:hypothetical protein